MVIYAILCMQDYVMYIYQWWKRFLDDCWLIWKDEFHLNFFFNVINDLHPAIQFTHKKDKHALSFSDITVIKHNDNSIHTDVFYKTTNAHRYLHFTSQHPGHIKRNIPFNLAKLLVRIISNRDTLSYRLEELKEFLFKRKYPDKLIDNGFLRA